MMEGKLRDEPALLITKEAVFLIFHEDDVELYPYGTPNRKQVAIRPKAYARWIEEEYERLQKEKLVEEL